MWAALGIPLGGRVVALGALFGAFVALLGAVGALLDKSRQRPEAFSIFWTSKNVVDVTKMSFGLRQVVGQTMVGWQHVEFAANFVMVKNT